MTSAVLLALALAQSFPDSLPIEWVDRGAESALVADRVSTLYLQLSAKAASVGASRILREEQRGTLWQRDLQMADNSVLRLQHDADADEWRLNRLDLGAIEPVDGSLNPGSLLLNLRDSLAAEGLIDGSLFQNCTPQINTTTMGGGTSAGERLAEKVVETSARCRASFRGVPVFNLGIQIRLRKNQISSLRFSRSRIGRLPSTTANRSLVKASPAEVQRAFPASTVKENEVVYLAERTPGRGATVFRLVHLLAISSPSGGAVSRVRLLVRESGSASEGIAYRETFLGDRTSDTPSTERARP
jgi:hypothetical protein